MAGGSVYAVELAWLLAAGKALGGLFGGLPRVGGMQGRRPLVRWPSCCFNWAISAFSLRMIWR